MWTDRQTDMSINNEGRYRAHEPISTVSLAL